MKKILTRKFGEIEIDETKIIDFPEGLPGFPGFDSFVLLEDEKIMPFSWLQSVDEPDLALILMNPFLFKEDYSLDLDAVIRIQNWENTNHSDLLVYVVINISDINKSITANLIGPIVINNTNKQAVQFVLSDSPYSHKHEILGSNN